MKTNTSASVRRLGSVHRDVHYLIPGQTNECEIKTVLVHITECGAAMKSYLHNDIFYEEQIGKSGNNNHPCTFCEIR
jgi:hypothetical protein